MAGLFDLIEVADDLPIGGKNGIALELRDASVEIPGRGDGPGFFERIGGIIEVQNFANALVANNQ